MFYEKSFLSYLLVGLLALFSFNALVAKSLFKGKEDIEKVPLVYESGYNIGCLGIEKLHPFDTGKYGKVFESLKRLGIKAGQFHKPGEASYKDLELVHTKRYLESLKNSAQVARVAELPFLQVVPNWLLQWAVLTPMRKATAGTALAAKLALENGRAAVNIGGGYHHAKKHEGGGFCFFADIPYAAEKLWQENPNLKIVVVDLDAHQGNGHEDYFKYDERVTVFDLYGEKIYPYGRDGTRKYITYNHPVKLYIEDGEYLQILENNLGKAMDESNPDIIFYNAGTDILKGDPVGGFNVSKEGIIKRDEMVFDFAKRNKVPVCMVTSGGYTSESARVISDSLENLGKKGYIPGLKNYLPRSVAEYL